MPRFHGTEFRRRGAGSNLLQLQQKNNNQNLTSIALTSTLSPGATVPPTPNTTGTTTCLHEKNNELSSSLATSPNKTQDFESSPLPLFSTSVLTKQEHGDNSDTTLHNCKQEDGENEVIANTETTTTFPPIVSPKSFSTTEGPLVVVDDANITVENITIPASKPSRSRRRKKKSNAATPTEANASHFNSKADKIIPNTQNHHAVAAENSKLIPVALAPSSPAPALVPGVASVDTRLVTTPGNADIKSNFQATAPSGRTCINPADTSKVRSATKHMPSFLEKKPNHSPNPLLTLVSKHGTNDPYSSSYLEPSISQTKTGKSSLQNQVDDSTTPWKFDAQDVEKAVTKVTRLENHLGTDNGGITVERRWTRNMMSNESSTTDDDEDDDRCSNRCQGEDKGESYDEHNSRDGVLASTSSAGACYPETVTAPIPRGKYGMTAFTDLDYGTIGNSAGDMCAGGSGHDCSLKPVVEVDTTIAVDESGVKYNSSKRCDKQSKVNSLSGPCASYDRQDTNINENVDLDTIENQNIQVSLSSSTESPGPHSPKTTTTTNQSKTITRSFYFQNGVTAVDMACSIASIIDFSLEQKDSEPEESISTDNFIESCVNNMNIRKIPITTSLEDSDAVVNVVVRHDRLDIDDGKIPVDKRRSSCSKRESLELSFCVQDSFKISSEGQVNCNESDFDNGCNDDEALLDRLQKTTEYATVVWEAQMLQTIFSRLPECCNNAVASALFPHPRALRFSRQCSSEDQVRFTNVILDFNLPVLKGSAQNWKQSNKTSYTDSTIDGVTVLGTLQDVFNLHVRYCLGPIPEPVIAAFVVWMIEILNIVHKCDVAHNNLGLDSFLVVCEKKARSDQGVFDQDSTDFYMNTWSLKLIGFGVKSCLMTKGAENDSDDSSETSESSRFRREHFERDTYALANIIHALILGGIPLTWRKSIVDRFEIALRSLIVENLYLRGGLAWDNLFDALLNSDNGLIGIDSDNLNHSLLKSCQPLSDTSQLMKDQNHSDLCHAAKMVDMLIDIDDTTNFLDKMLQHEESERSLKGGKLVRGECCVKYNGKTPFYPSFEENEGADDVKGHVSDEFSKVVNMEPIKRQRALVAREKDSQRRMLMSENKLRQQHEILKRKILEQDNIAKRYAEQEARIQIKLDDLKRLNESQIHINTHIQALKSVERSNVSASEGITRTPEKSKTFSSKATSATNKIETGVRPRQERLNPDDKGHDISMTIDSALKSSLKDKKDNRKVKENYDREIEPKTTLAMKSKKRSDTKKRKDINKDLNSERPEKNRSAPLEKYLGEDSLTRRITKTSRQKFQEVEKKLGQGKDINQMLSLQIDKEASVVKHNLQESQNAKLDLCHNSHTSVAPNSNELSVAKSTVGKDMMLSTIKPSVVQLTRMNKEESLRSGKLNRKRPRSEEISQYSSMSNSTHLLTSFQQKEHGCSLQQTFMTQNKDTESYNKALDAIKKRVEEKQKSLSRKLAERRFSPDRISGEGNKSYVAYKKQDSTLENAVLSKPTSRVVISLDCSSSESDSSDSDPYVSSKQSARKRLKNETISHQDQNISMDNREQSNGMSLSQVNINKAKTSARVFVCLDDSSSYSDSDSY